MSIRSRKPCRHPCSLLEVAEVCYQLAKATHLNAVKLSPWGKPQRNWEQNPEIKMPPNVLYPYDSVKLPKKFDDQQWRLLVWCHESIAREDESQKYRFAICRSHLKCQKLPHLHIYIWNQSRRCGRNSSSFFTRPSDLFFSNN